MKVSGFHLANYAEVRDSLVYAMGAYPEWWTVPSMPAISNVAVVLVAELESDELPTQQELDLILVRPSTPDDGEGIASVKFTHAANEDPELKGPFFQPVVFSFGIEFRQEGRHEFVVSQSGKVHATTSVHVRLGQEPLVSSA